MEAIFAHKRQVSEKLSTGMDTMLKNAKVDLIRGVGTIIASNAVRVTAGEGAQTYTADDILVATGSVPACPV
jgi:dihydrolipoamide dehydrogenase